MKLRLIVLGLLMVSVMIAVPVISQAQIGDTVANLQAKIRALQVQIDALKTQLVRFSDINIKTDLNSPTIARPNNANLVCMPLTRELKIGSTDAVTGGEVSKVQAVLKAEGVFPVSTPITGYFGPITLEAVKKLQVREGLLLRPAVSAPTDVQSGGVRTLEVPAVDSATRSILSDKYCYQVRGGAITPTLVGSGNLITPTTDLGGGQSDNQAEFWLKLLTPAAGEVLKKGQAYTIKWDSSSNISKIYLKLKKGSNHNDTVLGIADYLPNQKFYVWQVPITIETGSDYLISIHNHKDGVDDPMVDGRSPEYFTIID